MEETGLILEAGTWALRRAAVDHRYWVEHNLPAPRVAVNVSPIQLRQRDFVAAVEQAIIGGIAPTSIDLEITESLIMEDVQGSIEKLKAVRALGLQIAIDDFGTGYSSLAYLRRLPVDKLKLDQSFTRDVGHKEGDGAIIKAVLAMAQSLELAVVAEGVETQAQIDFLLGLGCTTVQGYMLGRPLPAAATADLLRERVQDAEEIAAHESNRNWDSIVQSGSGSSTDARTGHALGVR
jgi:EAL domain-containing protein (putative c-di-GMP-specific phosphodiesterase class I)